MPRVRRDAADMVRRGFSKEEVGRRYGVGSSTICKWVKKAKLYGYGAIPTKSSRPHHHPKEIDEGVVKRIVALRIKTRRTSEVVHQHLLNEGIKVSLNSVRRTIDRHGLMKKRSPWKRYHPPVDRPYPLKSGDLVEIDTIHKMISEKKRIYVFVLIDVYSRWIYAKAYERINGRQTIRFVNEAQRKSVFRFQMLQSDHGPEFSKWFTSRIEKNHRYTRIGKPNDNAHIERVNRTIQEECIDKVNADVKSINCALKKYLQYYNYERLHLGLNLKTPSEFINDSVQAIG
jgi:putative transposase